MKAQAKKYLHIGIGGYNCACCFPPRGSKARTIAFRNAKKRMKRDGEKHIRECLSE